MAEPTIRGIPDEDVAGLRDLLEGSRFDELVGLAWDLVSPQRVEAHLEADERHHQPFGLVHGGVYATLVESVASVGASLQVAGDGRLAVGVSNSTDFLRSHTTGRLDAVGLPRFVASSWQLWEVAVSRPTDGEEVARGTVRLQHLARGAIEDRGAGEATAG